MVDGRVWLLVFGGVAMFRLVAMISSEIRRVRPQPGSPALCSTCVGWARRLRLSGAYVYRNGHVLRPAAPAPRLDEWPAGGDKVRTFCGLDVYGMGASTWYRLGDSEG